MVLRSLRDPASTSPVILMIDPDRDFLPDSALTLTQEGYQVLTAVDSVETQYLRDSLPAEL